MTLPAGFGELVEALRRATVLVLGERGSAGSGLIISEGGAIVTNAHVARASRLHVQLWDGRTAAASVRARDQGRDLALLAVEAGGLPAAMLGDSRRLRVGELVIAVGNPFGFVGAVTTGVVYAVGPLQGLGPADWVQSDLQLAPGNSGGPLADASGTVMGLNTMISGRLALAVTSLAVRRFLRAQDPDGSLGVTLHPVQVSSGGSRRFGLLLVEVAGAGTAAQASLLPGDILVGTDAGPITALQDLEEALDGEGERVVQLHFLRGGRAAVRKASVLLGRARSRAA